MLHIKYKMSIEMNVSTVDYYPSDLPLTNEQTAEIRKMDSRVLQATQIEAFIAEGVKEDRLG